MPTDWKTRSAQIKAGTLVKTCEIAGCRLPSYRLGKLCAGHRTALKTKGSPTAGRVTLTELRPHRDMAMDFIAAQELKGHPAILAALDYLERLAKTAAAHEGPSPRQGQHIRPAARVDTLLARLARDGVDLRIILAWNIACEVHRLQDPRRWPDHTHAGHQFACAVVSLVRSRLRSGVSVGASATAIRRPSTGLLRELARQLRDPLIPVAIRAAQHLHDHIERTANPVPRAALYQPFTHPH